MPDEKQLADSADDQVDEMERRSDALEGDIEATRDDWEDKKRDSSVPGAAGMPEKVQGDDIPPEMDKITPGD